MNQPAIPEEISIIDQIRAHQKRSWSPRPRDLPAHKPDTLLIGCIDARLNPAIDIGIPYGNALIRRTIAALVPPKAKDSSQDFSETIAYALSHDIKHIIVMGHTGCGGLNACSCGSSHALPAVHDHLSIINVSDADKKDIRKLEAESIRISLENLRNYPGIENSGITLDGWIIDTNTRDISVYNENSRKLEPMLRTPITGNRPTDTLKAVAAFEPPPRAQNENTTIHEPELLMLTDIDARINPAGHIDIPYGKALIYRGFNPCAVSRTDEKAALQFAIKKKKVKDVVLMLHTDSDKYPGKTKAEESEELKKELQNGIEELKKNQDVQEALNAKTINLHAWLVDTTSRRILEMNLETKAFHPMGIESGIVPQDFRAM